VLCLDGRQLPQRLLKLAAGRLAARLQRAVLEEQLAVRFLKRRCLRR
jgi:hypothetical protein